MIHRLSVSGVYGLAAIELELGPLVALIGPRGSGKSQLLSSIAWLAGVGPAPAGERVVVSAQLDRGGQTRTVQRRTDDAQANPRSSALLPTSFLRAEDRLREFHRAEAGSVSRAMAERVTTQPTSDAESAEALVAAVEACCEGGLGSELVLIEEPELMLAPLAQRHLANLLRRLAKAGNQVVYSTWSPAFVDAVHAEEIVRLDLRASGTLIRRTSPRSLTDEQRLRLDAEFDHERSEMFFARCVVLAEGDTERFALPLVFRALGHDPDAEGIAVVEVGGKGNLPLVAGVLRDLRIPCVVVYDTDGGSDPRLDALIEATVGPERTVVLDPDFETVTGIRPRDEKVLAAWRRFADARPDDVPTPLRRVVELAAGQLAADDPYNQVARR